MPKVLGNSEYNALKEKADNYSTIVSAILATNKELKEEEITTDIVLQMISSDTAQDGTAENLKDLQSKYDSLLEENNQLKVENENLKGSPAEDPAAISSDKEKDAKPQSIADFADKNIGNTLAILAECKEVGLI